MMQDEINIDKIHLNEVAQNHTGMHHALLELLEGVYQEIVELDLETEMIFVLRNCNNPGQVGNSYPFAQEVDMFCDYQIMAEDIDIARNFLQLSKLREFYNNDTKCKSIQLRVCAKAFTYEWMELFVFSLSDTQYRKKKLLITLRNINDEKLMKSIVDNFVYATCDYFIHLDIKADNYTMFSGSTNGTPLPPTSHSCYSLESIKYAREFVVPEDQDYVIEQMGLDFVQKALDEHGEHTIYCGIADPTRGYTRKCIKYLYYDEKNKMTLLIRTDVTEVYLLEEQKNAQLRYALMEARTDSLTGIYNRKALETLICELLANYRHTSSGVFFFVDIDNFKQVNDKLGHSQGDFVLQFLSEKLGKIAPPQSIFGRLGGDEFIIFCPTLDRNKDLNSLATQLCCSFDDISDFDIEAIRISCSVGVALFPQHGTTYDELYEHADQALYISKNKKRQFTIYHT